MSFQAASSPLIVQTGEQEPSALSYTEMVEKFAQTTLKTKLPWFEEEQTFTGIKVTDLLKFYKIEDVTSVSFLALNDYTATTKIEDIYSYEPIIAYEINREKIKVRDKGPYWLIFNLKKYPELDNIDFHAQMVWQINKITIHSKHDSTKT
ncbi:hypothetical protein [Vibrio japonicus]|uniref:Oxidoreductase molybdopterin-binding domain-containing protein n=1 Tax=Vibrio japonicus TaxID=1824638 RepID=A0ABY5LQG2_9VIBR|nr:hypothetical protein [Vibrio japonicus]UUM33078.1 hypothetical protein NP165_16150 [Vibrio japonicus]